MREKPTPRGLYAIVDLTLLRERGLGSPIEVARALCQGGAHTLQLRAKDAGARELLGVAQALRAVTRELGVTFIVNDRADLARLCGADGVHLGQGDLPVAAVRELVGEAALIGLSTHSLAQVTAAQACGADYLGYGPVFATGTKLDPDPVQGLDALAAAVRASTLPVTAIGGLTLAHVAALRGTGVAAFAVISALLTGEPSAQEAARAFANAWKDAPSGP